MELNLLATQLELFHAIFDKSCDAVVIVDHTGTIKHWSSAATKLFGYAASESAGKVFNDLLTPPEFQTQVAAEFQVYQETGRSPYLGRIVEAKIRTKSNDEVWFEISLSDIHVEGHRWVLGIFRDVATRKQREKQLEVAATTDPLSGLSNRSQFQLLLEENIGSELILAIVDLDAFKQINDQHGHPVGDDAIRHVSSLLNSVFPDSICNARMGGDEFGVIASGMSDDQLHERFQRLLQLISGSEFSEQKLSLTTSIGVSKSTDGSTPRSLLTSADAALYRSKNEGRNRLTVVTDDPSQS